jgi:hypothetical protein
MRVWLRATESKLLVRKLQGLDGKEVIAKEKLEKMTGDVRAIVPPLGIYLRHGFEIEHAGAKPRYVDARDRPEYRFLWYQGYPAHSPWNCWISGDIHWRSCQSLDVRA